MRKGPRGAAGWFGIVLGALVLAGCQSGQGASSTSAQPGPAAQGVTRTYYVSADDVVWDYAPSGLNRIEGGPFVGDAAFVAAPSPVGLGRVYKKTIFREYTDQTFKTLKPREPAWEHLGILGPMMRAEVGDTIEVVFRNAAAHPHTVHPHGVFYEKSSEGAQYDDGTGKRFAVQPGATHTYRWPVPERAGPSASEGSSIVWMYHSHVEEEKDVNAGLIGPLLVTARGKARPDGSPTDVDREFVGAFLEFDENNSWHFAENIKTYGVKGTQVRLMDNFADPIYVLNLKETINGFIYGNTPAAHDEEGRARAVVSHGLDQLRDSCAALARQHGRRPPYEDRRRTASPDGHGRGRHAARQSGHLAVPLPHGSAPARRDGHEVHG